MDKVIVITGPTGVGKTDLSLFVAKHFQGEIINCDASQFRKMLSIGTAKIDVSKTEVPHHLIDILEPEDEFSIRDFQVLARQKIAELKRAGKLPFLVGGSGLYINAVLGDYDLTVPGRNIEFEKQYENTDNDKLYELLLKADPKAAYFISENNRRRILRALEIAGRQKKISENKSGQTLLYDALILCLTTDRDTLYDRINRRVDILFENGWIEETKELLRRGIDLSKVKDIGYSQIGSYLQGTLTLDEAKTIIRQKTRNYAKRQMTWFRNKMNCVFIEMDYQNIENTYCIVKEKIQEFIVK